MTGAALPGRFDDVVRIAVIRRFPTTSVKISTICMSLVMLGLIDAAALMPFSAAAAATADASVESRPALALVAFGGLGAAAVVVGMPRLSRSACATASAAGSRRMSLPAGMHGKQRSS